MPIATHHQYREMLSQAKAGHYAFAAINVTSLETLSAAMAGFAAARSDGILQISTGGGKHASGPVGDMALGAVVLAEAAHVLAERYDVLFALHTDHCRKKDLEAFLDPLIARSVDRMRQGQGPLFQSHMFDGSELPLAENLEIAARYLRRCAPMGIVLEVETGVVGGEEDGHDSGGLARERLYTTPEDVLTAHATQAPLGRFLLAATFGNVHGVYAPGNVKLEPRILRECQTAVAERHRTDPNPLDLVFHGGSGSSLAEIHETLDYGVVKMNVDTDCQYAFTRPIAEHMLKGFDGVLKVDGGVGNKKLYDPRSYLAKATSGMKERVAQAVRDLRADGRTILR